MCTFNSPLSQAESYVGKEYVDGVFDCADLVLLVQREVFGRELDVPPAFNRSAGVRGHARDLSSQLSRFTRPTPVPFTGCAVLLWEITRNGIPPLNRRWHLGTVFMHHGTPWLLHCQNETFGTRLQPLHEALSGPLHFESYLEWI